MKEILFAKDITKIYDGKHKVKVLKNVNMTVNEGDFVCIMGPSGSGKSTFLNVLSTVDMPTEGIVRINGESVYDMPEEKIAQIRYKSMGFVFQDFNLAETLTIRENIGVPLVLDEVSKDEIDKRTEELAKELNIFEVLDNFPNECSGGQRQRAACARALIGNPKLIVADEPTGSLDTNNSHELLEIFKKRNEEDGIAILMVTHDSMIASYAKKLVFLRDGKIDETLDRGELSQKEFFYKIIDITSKESQALFDKME